MTKNKRDLIYGAIGTELREERIAWAREQSNPQPDWLTPWGGLTETEREVDRRIGECLYVRGRSAGLRMTWVTKED